jgi:hypothetical protein
VIMLLISPRLARATDYMDDCASTDAPAAYVSAGCTNQQACWVDLDADFEEQILTCTLAPESFTGSYSGEYWGVTKYPGSPRDLSFWGTLASGTKFCCVADLASAESFPFVKVVAVGTDNADTMSWIIGSTELDDDEFPAYEFKQCEMHGELGDDVLRGPVLTHRLRSSFFAGGPGDDRIYMGGEKALAYGGLGADGIQGTPNGDEIYGESPGANPIVGSMDILSGEGGVDSIDGGPGGDRICGGSDGDTILGSNGNDVIDAGLDPYDVAQGGLGTDRCNPSTDCESGLLGTVNCSF